jgi:2-keto-4-pentenoate hydratase/2-oxohepta-3-ene-1,7-dioic acid hydratase in catechol pathway
MSSTVSALSEIIRLIKVKEGGRPVPPLPSLFFKASRSIAGHGDVVEIPKICQDDQADYEGELVVIIVRDAKNVSKEEALDYVLGYTAGDDISSRSFLFCNYTKGHQEMATGHQACRRCSTMGIF